MTFEQATALFANAGQEYQRAKAASTERDFEPRSLGLTASTSLANEISTADSKNVLGLLRGSERPDERIVFSAHEHHLVAIPSLKVIRFTMAPSTT